MTKLELSKELYDIRVILQAVKAYDQLAAITIEDAGDYIICSFDKCEYDALQTVAEFENYAIDATNSQMK